MTVWRKKNQPLGILATVLTFYFGNAGEPRVAQRVATTAVPPACIPVPVAPGVINVKTQPYGAKGDGATDDTAAIQRAIRAAAGSFRTVLIPKGTYMINPTADSGRNGLLLGSRMTLRLAPEAVLKALPSSSESYSILVASRVSDVKVIGGTLLGERSAHKGTTGEWGMGLTLYNARNVTVQDVTARECWGDGFYIAADSRQISLCRVTADHNRRQGLSITGANGVLVSHSTFENTGGTPGESGLDIEPNRGDTVCNVLITGCTVRNNGGEGIASGVPFSHTGLSFVRDIVIDGNTVSGNGRNRIGKDVPNGIALSNSSGTRVTNNHCRDNLGRGILLGKDANNTICTGNTVTGTRGRPGHGIAEDSSSGNLITGNTVTGNAGPGIYSAACSRSTISGNAQSGNGIAP